MKVQGLSDKAMRFRLDDKHHNSPSVSTSGVLIHFVEIGDWVRVMIEVGENTTHEALRDAIPLAISWRDRLLKWQGLWMEGGDNLFLEELSQRQEDGETYTDLAQCINHKTEELLNEFIQYLDEFSQAKTDFKTIFDFYVWRSRANPFALDHARDLLRAVKLKDDEIKELLQSGLDNLRARKPAFEREYPVSKEKLRRTLRTWRENVKHQSHDQEETQA